MDGTPDAEQVLRWIAQNEDQTVEFKLEREPQPDIAETLAAFANAQGGVVLFGVGDDRSLVGVRDVKAITLRIWAAARNVTPRLDETIGVAQVAVQGRQLVVVQVPDDLAATYLAGTVYRIRQGAQNVLMSAQAIIEHARNRGVAPFDQETVSRTSLADLDAARLLGFLRRRAGDAVQIDSPAAQSMLHNLAILGDNRCRECATVAGLLMFGSDPQQHLPQSVLQCARFLGTTVTRFLDRVEIGGPIAKQVASGMDFVTRNIRRGTIISGIEHVDIDEYPLTAIREALVNALCHRDYYARGSVVNLSIFDDRIEIINPGGLLPGLRSDALEGAHKLRNAALGQLMYEAGLIERWGSGILRMRTAMEAAGLPAPQIRADRDWFHILFRGPGASFLAVSGQPQLAGSGSDQPASRSALPMAPTPQLNKRQRRLLGEMSQRRNISREEYEQEYELSTRTAARDLSELVALGLLRREGESRAIRYTIP